MALDEQIQFGRNVLLSGKCTCGERESCGKEKSQYLHQKIILGNRVPVNDAEIVEYIIEGIPDTVLRDLARVENQNKERPIRVIRNHFKDITSRTICAECNM